MIHFHLSKMRLKKIQMACFSVIFVPPPPCLKTLQSTDNVKKFEIHFVGHKDRQQIFLNGKKNWYRFCFLLQKIWENKNYWHKIKIKYLQYNWKFKVKAYISDDIKISKGIKQIPFLLLYISINKMLHFCWCTVLTGVQLNKFIHLFELFS